jgi:hypothetical protein
VTVADGGAPHERAAGVNPEILFRPACGFHQARDRAGEVTALGFDASPPHMT